VVRRDRAAQADGLRAAKELVRDSLRWRPQQQRRQVFVTFHQPQHVGLARAARLTAIGQELEAQAAEIEANTQETPKSKDGV
jgi:hypothetical protein